MMTKRENILRKMREMNLMERGSPSHSRLRANNSMVDRLQRMRDFELDKLIKKERGKALNRLAFIEEFGEDEAIDDVLVPNPKKFRVWKR